MAVAGEVHHLPWFGFFKSSFSRSRLVIPKRRGSPRSVSPQSVSQSVSANPGPRKVVDLWFPDNLHCESVSSDSLVQLRQRLAKATAASPSKVPQEATEKELTNYINCIPLTISLEGAWAIHSIHSPPGQLSSAVQFPNLIRDIVYPLLVPPPHRNGSL